MRKRGGKRGREHVCARKCMIYNSVSLNERRKIISVWSASRKDARAPVSKEELKWSRSFQGSMWNGNFLRRASLLPLAFLSPSYWKTKLESNFLLQFGNCIYVPVVFPTVTVIMLNWFFSFKYKSKALVSNENELLKQSLSFFLNKIKFLLV